jgi:hypothetical protein
MSESEAIISYLDNPITYNCFCTIAEADAYHGRRLGNTLWKEAEDPTKRAVLFNATDILNKQRWTGTLTSSTQSLAFPRQNVPIKDSNEYFASKEIPLFLKYATADLASFLLQKDKAGENEFSPYDEQISDIQLGKLKIKLKKESEYIPSIPKQVLLFIRDFVTSVDSKGGRTSATSFAL